MAVPDARIMCTSFSEPEEHPSTPEPTANRLAENCSKPFFIFDGVYDSLYTMYASSMLINPAANPDQTFCVSVYAWTIFTLKIVFLLINLINLRMIQLYTTPKKRCFLKTEYLLMATRFALLVLGHYELFKNQSSTKFSLSLSLYLSESNVVDFK